MIRYTMIFAFLLISITGVTQHTITGLVEDNETGSPVSYATVASEKGVGTMSDSAGKFSFDIRKQARLKDSLVVSATGYEPKRIAIKDLLGNGKVRLSQKEKVLEQVKVFASLKGDHRRFGYYREWKVKNQGGEIGYIFDLAARKVEVGKIQVKVNHNYDTCWLKLHLRDAATGGLSLPENELLKKDVILPATVKYGLVEFDLGWETITIPTSKLYVGFELLKCGCAESSVPSFFFLGNEEGVNFYKDTLESSWQRGGEYTIYVRMLTK